MKEVAAVAVERRALRLVRAASAGGAGTGGRRRSVMMLQPNIYV